MVAYLIAKAIHHGGRAAAPHIANAGRAAAPHIAHAARGAVHIARSAFAAQPTTALPTTALPATALPATALSTPVFPTINPGVIGRLAVPTATGGALVATGAVVAPHLGRSGAAVTTGTVHASRAAAQAANVHGTVGHTIVHEGGRLAAEGLVDEGIHLGVEKGIKKVQEHRAENAAKEPSADAAN
jgi:hypothetical protein